MSIQMGRWDCPKCGQTNLGPDRHCASCGYRRDNDVKFYLPENEPEVTDAEQLAQAKAGPDWECAYCQANNRAQALHCVECGAPRSGKLDRETPTYSPAEIPRSADEASVLDSYVQPQSQPRDTSYRLSSRTSGRQNKLVFGLLSLAVVVLALYGVYAVFFQRHEIPVQVNSFSWSRVVQIEEYRTVAEGDWSVPATGRLTGSTEKIHHYRQVFSHYETKFREVFDHTETYNCGSHTRDLGNGYFETVQDTCSRSVYRTESYQDPVYRDEPVYQTWFTYDIDKWVPSRQATAAGNNRSDPAPHWPEFELNLEGEVSLGAERESARSERYMVEFVTEEGKTYSLQTTQADWSAYQRNQEYILVVDNFDNIKNDPLRPESD